MIHNQPFTLSVNNNLEQYWKPTNVDIVAKHLQNNTPEDQIEKYMQYIINQHEQ